MADYIIIALLVLILIYQTRWAHKLDHLITKFLRLFKKRK